MKQLISRDFPIAKNSIFSLFDSPWFIDTGFQALPAANVIDNEKEYKIDIAAPGLKEEDFNITIKDNTLLVKAEKELEKKEEKDNYIKTEYNYNSFSRLFHLEDNVNDDAVTATYKNGVLELIIPKLEVKAKKNGKQIKVNNDKAA